MRSPTLTGAMYSKRLPPLSQPLPYSSASARWIEVGAMATRNVGGASLSQRGLGSPMASANRLRWPASTVAVVGGAATPIWARSRSTTEVICFIRALRAPGGSSTAGEPEHALGDDVALDLGRACVDRLGLRPHPSVLPPSFLDRQRRAWRERTVRSLDANRDLLDALVHLAPVELGERGLRSGRIAVLGFREVAQAVEPEYVRLNLRLRHLLANGDVGAGAAVAGQSAALEPEDRHGDLPARGRFAHDVTVFHHRARQKYLAELTAACHLPDPPHFDTRLVHVDQEEGDAFVRLGLGVAAREQEALVGVVPATRPGLLTVEDPVPIVPFRPGAQTRQVTARVGLAEALAEVQVAGEDLLDVGVLLPLRSVDEQGGREEAHAEPSQDDGRSRLLHLLLVNGLHDRGRLATARLLGPGELQPAGFVKAALPLTLEIGLLVLSKPPHSAVAPLCREVAIEPVADLEPEGFLVSREAQIHGFNYEREPDIARLVV